MRSGDRCRGDALLLSLLLNENSTSRGRAKRIVRSLAHLNGDGVGWRGRNQRGIGCCAQISNVVLAKLKHEMQRSGSYDMGAHQSLSPGLTIFHRGR